MDDQDSNHIVELGCAVEETCGGRGPCAEVQLLGFDPGLHDD
jgi:hypothetical protein